MERHRSRILGAGVVCGAGRGVDRFWEAIYRARAGQGPGALRDPRLDSARYVAITNRRDPGDAGDLASLWAQLAIEDALGQAEVVIERLQPARRMLIGATSLGGMSLFEAQHRRWWDPRGQAGTGLPVDSTLATERAEYDGPTTYLAQHFGMTSGGWTLNTACSSAANGLGLAHRWLHHHRLDLAVVVGFDAISPFVYAGFAGLHALDPAASAPFGVERRGLNLGEAAVAIVLGRAADAEALGTPASSRSDIAPPVDLIGYGSSCDAHHLTRPDLSGGGLARAIDAALRDGGVGSEQIDFVSAHGTGTPFNDTMEAAAFARIFGARKPPMHCAKPVAGHTLGAAGAIDALLVREALRRGTLPPTFRRGADDPELAFHPAPTAQSVAASAVALSTSSGFGGSNAALLFARGNSP